MQDLNIASPYYWFATEWFVPFMYYEDVIVIPCDMD